MVSSDPPVSRERREIGVCLVLRALLAARVILVSVVLLVRLVQLVLLDCLVHKDQRDPRVHLVLLVKKETPGRPDLLVLLVLLVKSFSLYLSRGPRNPVAPSTCKRTRPTPSWTTERAWKTSSAP